MNQRAALFFVGVGYIVYRYRSNLVGPLEGIEPGGRLPKPTRDNPSLIVGDAAR